MAGRSWASPSAQTTALTALLAAGGARPASCSPRGCSAAAPIRYRVAALGALVGVARLHRRHLRRTARHRRRCSRSASTLIGFGGGLFAARHADRRDGHGAATARSAWRSAPGARCRPSAAGMRHRRSAACIRDVVSGLAADGAARPGADRRRRPATAPSTTSRSAAVRHHGRDRPARAPVERCPLAAVVEFRPRRVPRLAKLSAEVMRCHDWRHHRLHRRSPGRRSTRSGSSSPA